jgi:geranyl-CoA carboxylase beta subunit
MVIANDSGIDAGALTDLGNQKLMRCQQLALENRLPLVMLVESAGSNLNRYRVDKFVRGGGMFFNLARLSAAGLPVVTVVHGSSTAGGAYFPGLSDYVIMVRGRARAFLAGPPLLRAATGEVATEEELGGADMHSSISGLAEYIAEDDAQALTLARSVMAWLDWPPRPPTACAVAPRYDRDELLAIMPHETRKPVDMHEVIARIVDDSAFLDYKAGYGPATVCGRARIGGHTVGIVTNNGPLDPPGSTKAAQFVQSCEQSGTPIVWLQNTTGFIVGRASEEAGMIKHGSKLIQAIANASVPQITVYCGASYGAGNYGMCGRSANPRFCFSWPNARTAVMGGQQAAATLDIVGRAKAARRGEAVDEAKLAAQQTRIIENFERQANAFYTSGLLLDDGVIDPRDTRAVLAFTLDVCAEAAARTPRRVQFGVARL